MKTKPTGALPSAGRRRDSRCFRPKEKNTERLLKIVGMDKFLTLRDEFGGRSLWIPKRGGVWPCGLCKMRDHCIIRWHRQGHSPAALSSALKMKPAAIGRIIASVRKPRARRATATIPYAEV